MVLTSLIYLILWGTSVVVMATRYQDPALLWKLTREDGVVEWFTVLALLALAVFLVRGLWQLGAQCPLKVKVPGYALAVLSLLAVGEEISWGQRLFGFQTSEAMKKINYQHETNLHNLMPAELFNGLIIFSVGIFMILIPLFWRRKNPTAWWLPSEELTYLTLAAIAVNHYRVVSIFERAGLAVLGLILLWGTFQSIRYRKLKPAAACLTAWLTFAVLFSFRQLLPAVNHQYEIRELLVILLATRYCWEVLDNVKAALGETVEVCDTAGPQLTV
jgi:hypothetical protein